MSRFVFMVSLVLLLVTCSLSANVATKSGLAHRHLRHQLVSRVVRHVHRAHVKEDPTPCRYGDRTVQSGWKGPGLGENGYNTCTCNDGMLICTQVRVETAPAPAAAAAPASAAPAGASDDDGDDDGDDDDSADDSASDEIDKAEQSRLRLAIITAQEALAENLHKQEQLRKKKALLENLDTSDKEIDATARLVANETESAAMAGMLGSMWKDIRMLEAPEYTKYLGEQIEKLKEKEKLLQQDLSAAQAALASDQAGAAVENEAVPEVPASIRGREAPVLEKASAAEDSSRWQPWWVKRSEAIWGGLVYIVSGLIFAFIYYEARKRKNFLSFEQDHKAGVWSIPIFGCCSNTRMCLLGFFCPYARWADTVDRARVGFSYWPGVALMLVLMVLQTYSYGVTALIVVGIGVTCRQRLRVKYRLPYGRATYAEDIFVWCCCQPCAIIQEAHEEVANRDM
mmetsp:Transcript_27466/g.50071  ORF Transcript_27466/g.50071 Transcript_27466/m.50071 type:complete len:455 (+) Transcript_27466:107-1471(+)